MAKAIQSLHHTAPVSALVRYGYDWLEDISQRSRIALFPEETTKLTKLTKFLPVFGAYVFIKSLKKYQEATMWIILWLLQ